MYFPDKDKTGFYITVSSVDISSENRADIEAILGYGDTTYMNDKSLYITDEFHKYEYGWNHIKTKIIKFTIDKGLLGYGGAGIVPGRLLNQFSMDEYNGYFRVATTENSYSNNLFVLGPALDIVGSITNLAEGEKIYSVRFMGDFGYIVTYREIDPLFAIDISDPTKPRVTGQLKIPGFSNYLHPISGDVLLGIGRDAVGAIPKGLKLSLFNVSDKTDPKEICNLILGDNAYAEVLENHKAAMFNPSKGMLAFDCSIREKDGWFDGAIIIDYNNNTLTQKGRIERKINSRAYDNRLLYIGDVIYYIEYGLIRSFNINTLKPISELSF